MMQHVTGQLESSQRLSVVKSEMEQALTGRAYSARQVELITKAQTVKHSFATQLAYAAGLRAHELLTLARIGGSMNVLLAQDLPPVKNGLDVKGLSILSVVRAD